MHNLAACGMLKASIQRATMASVWFMIGQKLNKRYEIREHLGDGSTATVYKAYDLLLGRDVAIKMLLPGVRKTTRERFLQEATAAAQLNHPNIMSIYDMGKDSNRDYLVVEYVDGESLTEYIPAPPDIVVELGVQIAMALQYAHERGIIHRDIKPANIKVTPDGQVKIMDLGLALPREAKRVTAHGMVIGTPAYLSPEQAQGRPLDHRTDIYSLGIVLYEMLTGQLPFNADDISALLLQQVRQPPPPPRLIVENLPVALENVVLKALEKAPERRFQSCRSLAAALEAALPREEVAPDAPTSPRRPLWAETLQAEPLSRTGPAISTGKPPLRIVLADDHAMLRRTLASFLASRDGFMVVGEAADGNTALEQTLHHMPDVLILDLNMPGRGGLDVLPEIRQEAPSVKVLVLTGREEDAYIIRALRAGAHGYVLKSADEDDLIEAIHKVMDGQLVLGRGVAEKIVTDFLVGNTDSNRLTDEETELLLYVAAGYTNDMITNVMDMRLPQVIEMLARVMDKLQARDRHDAALKALRKGLILLEDLHNIVEPGETG